MTRTFFKIMTIIRKNQSKNCFEIKYHTIISISFFDKKSIYSKRNFLEKYKRYNLRMTNLISQTGKSPKKYYLAAFNNIKDYFELNTKHSYQENNIYFNDHVYV